MQEHRELHIPARRAVDDECGLGVAAKAFLQHSREFRVPVRHVTALLVCQGFDDVA